MNIKAQSPGKIILSGEHAVVYGKPALVMAVNRYATVCLEPLDTPSLAIFFDKKTEGLFPLSGLPELSQILEQRYHEYLEGKKSINKVLHSPGDLIAYAVGLLLPKAHTQGIQLDIRLDIPVGCGMGASAAVILSVLKVVSQYLDRSCDLYELALKIENMQHGKSSGVDPYACLHGGFIKFCQGKNSAMPSPSFNFYLVNTGKPECSTGECVTSVREHFGDSIIWEQFNAATDYIEQAVREKNNLSLRHGIQRNHAMLCEIGVTPERIQNFIYGVEQAGGAGKICGAGAIRGDAAGLLLLVSDEAPLNLCKEFGYSLFEVREDQNGTKLI